MLRVRSSGLRANSQTLDRAEWATSADKCEGRSWWPVFRAPLDCTILRSECDMKRRKFKSQPLFHPIDWCLGNCSQLVRSFLQRPITVPGAWSRATCSVRGLGRVICDTVECKLSVLLHKEKVCCAFSERLGWSGCELDGRVRNWCCEDVRVRHNIEHKSES